MQCVNTHILKVDVCWWTTVSTGIILFEWPVLIIYFVSFFPTSHSLLSPNSLLNDAKCQHDRQTERDSKRHGEACQSQDCRVASDCRLLSTIPYNMVNSFETGHGTTENIRMMSASWVCLIGTYNTSRERVRITSVSLFCWNMMCLYSSMDIKT